jgi:hypothetical protein
VTRGTYGNARETPGLQPSPGPDPGPVGGDPGNGCVDDVGDGSGDVPEAPLCSQVTLKLVPLPERLDGVASTVPYLAASVIAST